MEPHAHRPPTVRRSPANRSRVTNGSALLSGVDGRSVWARRLRDLIELHEADLGGADAASTAERSIVRRAAVLETELERLEAKFAMAGEASATDLDLYQRTSNSVRRLLEAVGLKRVAKDVTPSLEAYISARYGTQTSGGETAGRAPAAARREGFAGSVPRSAGLSGDEGVGNEAGLHRLAPDR
jgi:hypothetical protein